MSLTGGSGPYEGNVLVGGLPVCDDYWGDTNAGVVCRMLGYIAGVGVTGSYFGTLGTIFGMDDVVCGGEEESIVECYHQQQDDCGEREAAGVICDQHNNNQDTAGHN